MLLKRTPRAVGLALFLAIVSLLSPVAAASMLSGTVTDDAGQAAGRAEVVLEPVDGQGARSSAVASKMGTFLLDNVAPGRYHLAVRLAGKTLLAVQATAEKPDRSVAWKIDGALDPAKPPVLEVTDGLNVKVVLTVGAAVEMQTPEGTVLIAPQQALAQLVKRIQGGDCAGALPNLERLTTSFPDVARAQYLLAFCRAQTGATEPALASLAKLRELQPKFPGAALLEGQVLARGGKAAEAEAAMKREIDNAANPQVVAEAWIGLGLLHRDQGKDADAAAAFEQATSLAPARPEPYAELAGLYVKADQLDKATAVLDRAAEAGAASGPAWLSVGIAYYKKKDCAHAQEAMRAMIQIGGANGDLSTAYAVLGRCALRDGKTADGLASLRKSLDLDPGSSLSGETRQILQSYAGKK
jgi:tetratricopeptide (TPR) repeat protein